jgi:transposase-like protein
MVPVVVIIAVGVNDEGRREVVGIAVGASAAPGCYATARDTIVC